jgi:hypothetical protein
MKGIFDASRKVIKQFDSKIKRTFWKVVKFEVGVCKSELNLVLILLIFEFDSYKLYFWRQIIKGKKHCDFNGRIFRFFYN